MPKNFFPLKWQKNLLSPEMAMVRISASFPHGMMGWNRVVDRFRLHFVIGVDFWGGDVQLVHVPPIIVRCLCFHQLLLPYSSHQYFGLPHPYIFYKSMPASY